jgi:hypothetical protein
MIMFPCTIIDEVVVRDKIYEMQLVKRTLTHDA